MQTTSYLERHKRAAGILCVLLVTLLAFAIAGGNAHAQDAAEITPNFGNGKLTVTGMGFKPNEKVTMTVKIDSGTSTFSATANGQGSFELDTGLVVKPGSSVELDARGDQGHGYRSFLIRIQTHSCSSHIRIDDAARVLRRGEKNHCAVVRLRTQ